MSDADGFADLQLTGGLGTTREFQTFLIDNDLVVSLGVGEDDEFCVTAKGRAVWEFFELCRRAGDRAWERTS